MTMSYAINNKKTFNKILKEACKGTSVSPKEVIQDLIRGGAIDLFYLDLSKEDVQLIVADLVESKEISSSPFYSNTVSTRRDSEPID